MHRTDRGARRASLAALPAVLAALPLLLAGCSAPPAGPEPGPAPAEPTPVEPTLAGSGSFMLGMPNAGPFDGAAVVGLQVPANATLLAVEVKVTQGVANGLRTLGVAGCEHDFPTPAVQGDALSYSCQGPPGSHNLSIVHSGGYIAFDVRVTASAPSAPPAA